MIHCASIINIRKFAGYVVSSLSWLKYRGLIALSPPFSLLSRLMKLPDLLVDHVLAIVLRAE